MAFASAFSTHEMTNRVTNIRQKMAENDVDALIITNAANIRYLTGFQGEPRTVLITDASLVLYTSYRTLPWAEKQCSALVNTIELVASSSPLTEIQKRLKSSLKIGTDHAIAHRALQELRNQFSAHQVGPCAIIEEVRRIKSSAEISLMQQSQILNEGIFRATLPLITLGMTERAVQGLMLAQMASNELVERYSFEPIVAFGPNAWEIHHLPDDTPISPDQMLLLDLGVFHQGYASDMTRTTCLGNTTDQMLEVYEIVKTAQSSAIAAMRPGVTTHEIDRIARNIISEAGYARGFTHGLGHSIGLETHDPGLNLSQSSPETLLEEGMVFTVEPGIYLEDGFGVRTEDVVVVTADGTQRLTTEPLDLIELTF